jgi:hypothetical protein
MATRRVLLAVQQQRLRDLLELDVPLLALDLGPRASQSASNGGRSTAVSTEAMRCELSNSRTCHQRV